MLYKTLSVALYGMDANIVEVEVDVSGVKMSEDHFHAVGLPDAAVRESRDRVRSTSKNCGCDISYSANDSALYLQNLRSAAIASTSPLTFRQ